MIIDNELIETYLLRMKADKISGEKPTKRQVEIMLYQIKKYSQVNIAKELGISLHSVITHIQELSERCPQIYKFFKFERFKHRRKKRIICTCGCPEGFGKCYKCWRIRQRKKYPNLYKKDSMFPANGKTISKLSFGGKYWYKGEIRISCYTQ